MSGLDFLDYTFRMHTKGGQVVNFQAARFTTAKISDKLYNAWLAEDGAYVIMERDFTNLTQKYFFRSRSDIDSSNDLATDWANRENLSYVDYSALFA